MKVLPSEARPADEDLLVAELELLGVSYLSRSGSARPTSVRPHDQLVADLVRQPSARLRQALIAVLLAHPELAAAVPAALAELSPPEQLTLRVFYTAAVLLQQEHANRLQTLLTTQWQFLPDLFAMELGLPRQGSPRDRLAQLGQTHRRLSGTAVNWTGTYENVARNLLRRLEMEHQWNRSLP